MLLLETELAEAALWGTHKLRRLKPLEHGLETYMMKAYRGMERRFYAAWPEHIAAPVQEAEPAGIPMDWIDQLEFEATMNGETFESYAARSALLGHDWLMREMGLPAAFRLPFPQAQTFLAEYGAAQVSSISDSTRRELRDVLYRGRVQGWSYDRLAKVLQEKWAQFRTPQPQQHIRSRAHLIAVNETANAYERGNELGREQVRAAGLVVEKSWLMVGDDRTCMICFGNAGIGFLPDDRSFPSGHTRAPAHPACRCTVVSRVSIPVEAPLT